MLLPHTILNVQFLSINSILCQFQNSFRRLNIEFKKIHAFQVMSKARFLDKKWRFGTVCCLFCKVGKVNF